MSELEALNVGEPTDPWNRARFWWFLGVSGAWWFLTAMAPSSWSGAALFLYVTVTFFILLLRCRSLRGGVRTAATLIVVAGGVSVVGTLGRGLLDMSGTSVEFPSALDLFPMFGYVLLLIAIAFVVKRRVGRLGLDPVLDAVVAGVSVTVLQWSFVVLPYVKDADHTGVQRYAVALFSVLSLLLIVAAVLALVAGSIPTASNRLLAAGLVSTFVVDVAATLVASGRASETVVGVGSALSILLGGAGILHPSIRGMLDRPDEVETVGELTRRRMVVLAFALVTPPCILLWRALVGREDLGMQLATIGAVVLAPLVLVRLGRLVRQNESLASKEGALRAVGELLVEAETDADVGRILGDGLRRLVRSEPMEVGLVQAPFGPDSEGWTLELGPAVRAMEAESEVFERASTGDLHHLRSVGVDGEWYAGLIVLQGELSAVLILGLSGMLANDQRNAITALCRQGAIAMRAVERTEELVRERAERRFGTLIENSADIVTILGEDNTLLYTSPVTRRLLGIEPEPGFEFQIPQLVHPEDHEKAHELLRIVRERGYATEEIRLRHLNNTYLWFEVQATDLISDPDVGGILINARAVDDRKDAEQLLKLSEARFKSLVQNNTDLVMVVDDRALITYSSPSSVGMLGEAPDLLYGRPMSDVFTATDIDWNTKLREAAKAGGTFEFDFTRATSGERFTFEAMVTDLRTEPAVDGFVFNARDVTERNRMALTMYLQTRQDSLTGLPNRSAVTEDLFRMLERNPGATSVSTVCIDLDNFRDINESLGQDTGDKVLKAVARRIQRSLTHGAQAARVGADEFVLIVEHSHGEDTVMELTTSILEQLAQPFDIEGRQLTLTASAGVAVDHNREFDAEMLISNAITAVHQAKKEGRGRIARFESSMRAASSNRLEMRGDLARAIGTEQIVVHYQPLVDLHTRMVTGAEALVRWDHPERGRLSPALFIPIAEDSGLIDALDAQVRGRACKDLATWRAEIPGAEHVTVSVNLSVGELRSDDLVDSVMHDLRVTNLPADALVLEVTESHLLEDSDTVRTKMQDLRAQGVRLAVDDFGTGYSSLGYIDRFEFDVLKIDRSFVAGLATEMNQRIISAVLDLAKQLDATVVAEGIEEPEQEEQLKAMGCEVGQGYLYSRPVAANQFRRMLIGARPVLI